MTTSRTPKADLVLAEAVDAARSTLTEAVGPADVGDHIGVQPEGDRVLTHSFAATATGYLGWRWAVTLARAPRQKAVTVNEIVLLPGTDALVAPEWVPWKDRVESDDLGPGDLIPVEESDVRLVPGYLVGDADIDESSARDAREVVHELGLGRERVLSIEGRERAAVRWYEGMNGPDNAMTSSAPGRCGGCGFLVRLADPLGTVFGVCGNGDSPSDGRAVSFDHGCGAHSDVRAEPPAQSAASAIPVHDTLTWDDADIDTW